MAVDGSLVFDTKIDTEGVEKGTESLKTILNRLINSIEGLAKTVDSAINSIGFEKVNTGLKQVEQSADMAKESTMELGSGAGGAMAQAEMSAEELEKALDAITVTHYDAVENSIDQVTESLSETSVKARETSAALDNIVNGVPEELNNAANAGNEFKSTIDLIKQTAMSLPGVFTQIGINIKSAFDGVDTRGTNAKIQNLVDSLDRYKDRLASLESQGYYFGDREYDKTYQKVQQLTRQLNDYKKSLTDVDNGQKKVAASANKTGKEMNRMSNSTNNGRMSMLKMLKMSLLFSVTFQALSGVINAVKTGFQNLAQYSDSTNKTLSGLMTSMLTLKNSLATAFNPILTAIAPALQTLINYLVQAVTAAGQFFAVFFNGATTFTKAKDAQIDYAKSLDKSAKSAKGLDNALSPIDRLNVVSDPASNSTGTPGMPKPSEMFEDVPIDSKFIESVNKLKDTLKTLFEPIKDAWDTYGKPTMDALQYAADSIKESFVLVGKSFADIWLNGSGETLIGNILQLLTTVLKIVGDIGTAFQNAWKADGTGNGFIQSIFDSLNSILELLRSIGESFRDAWNSGVGEDIISNILQILTNVNTTITNIADNFKKAWGSGDTGTKIIQDILNMFNDILGAVKNMSKATSDWAKGLDFKPILTAFQNLSSSLEPLVGTVSDGLSWFYTNVLLPIAGWTITNVVPTFFDGLVAALDLVNGVLEALEPLGTWLFESFLRPIAEWTGGVIVTVLNGIVTALQSFADWINENKTAVEIITTVIGSFVAAWGIVNLAVTIGGIVTALAAFVTTGGLAATVGGALAAVIGFLTSPVTLVVAAIGALIAIGVLLVRNWDTVKEGATKIWGAIKDWFKKTLESIGKFFENLWNSIQGFFKGVGAWFRDRFTEAVTGIKSVFSTIGSWFGARWTDIKNAFATVGSWFSTIFTGAITGIKNIFSSIGTWFGSRWTDIKNVFSGIGAWFTERFQAAYQGIKTAFSPIKEFFQGLFNGLIGVVRDPINAIIDIMNGMIGGIVTGVNTVIKAIDSISFTVPDWIPGVGGKTVGFDLKPIDKPKIPKIPAYATGTVVPANYGSFLSILGDNKRDPEVVSPVPTMKQAFKEALTEMGSAGNGPINLNVYLDGKQIHSEIVKQDHVYRKQTGKSAFSY